MKSSLHTHRDKKKKKEQFLLICQFWYRWQRGLLNAEQWAKDQGEQNQLKKKYLKYFPIIVWRASRTWRQVCRSSVRHVVLVYRTSHIHLFLLLLCGAKDGRRNTHAPQEVIRGLRADYFASLSNNGTLSRWQLQSVRPTATFTLSASSVVIHSFARTPPIRNLPQFFEAWFWLVVHRAAGITFKYQEQKKWHLWPKCNIKVQTVMKKKPSLQIKNGEWNNSKNKLKLKKTPQKQKRSVKHWRATSQRRVASKFRRRFALPPASTLQKVNDT